MSTPTMMVAVTMMVLAARPTTTPTLLTVMEEVLG